ncbi:hypothetical protein JXB27_03650 [Candidatus Woesearchaeota archaeon]|nr:hypothetical protein [Candidatus Woesearchaeota archaeon]
MEAVLDLEGMVDGVKPHQTTSIPEHISSFDLREMLKAGACTFSDTGKWEITYFVDGRVINIPYEKSLTGNSDGYDVAVGFIRPKGVGFVPFAAEEPPLDDDEYLAKYLKEGRMS